MLTIDLLSKRLALSEWQTRRLVYALRPLLQDALASKPGQALQIPSSAIGLIERAAQMKSEGVSLGSLAQTLQEEMGSTTGKAPMGNSERSVQATPLESASPLADGPWLIVVAAKDELIAAQREEIAHLRSEVDRLMPLALPRPRRGLWAVIRRKAV